MDKFRTGYVSSLPYQSSQSLENINIQENENPERKNKSLPKLPKNDTNVAFFTTEININIS
jgi:hypothetical protein